MTSKRAWFGALASVLALFVLSSCSSSKHASTSSSTAPAGASSSAGPSAPVAGSPIKVGFICSCSGGGGLFAVNVPVEEVYKAWVNTINASGGIDGHPIDLITEDDAGNPGTSLGDAQTLISDHVVAIADNSSVDSAFASAVQAANIPVVGVLTNGLVFNTNPDFYPEGQTLDSILYAIVATAKSAGATNIGDVYCVEAVQCAQTVSLIRSAGAELDVPDVYNESISASAPNYTAPCVAAQQKHVTSLFIGDAGQVAGNFASNCAQQGYTPVYVLQAPTFTRSVLTAKGLSTNTWFQSADIPWISDIPAVQEMNTAVDKYYPGLRQNQQLWFENDAMAWASGLLLEDAVKAGGLTQSATPSAGEIVSGLNSLKGDTLDGMAPPLTFTAGKPHLVDCWFTAHVQDGTGTVANNGRLTCMNGSSAG